MEKTVNKRYVCVAAFSLEEAREWARSEGMATWGRGGWQSETDVYCLYTIDNIHHAVYGAFDRAVRLPGFLAAATALQMACVAEACSPR